MRILNAIIWKMGRKFGIQVTFLAFLLQPAFGQDISPQTDLELTLQTIIEDFTEFNNGTEDFDFNTLYEDLLLISSDNLDINKATPEELARLIFLSDLDIQNIIEYRTKYGPFLSIYELQAVPGLAIDKVSTMSLFVRVGAASSSPTSNALELSELSNTKDQLYLKWKYNIETAQGFISENNNPPKYVGDKHHLYLRYNHRSTKSSYGLIMEKDPGERFTSDLSETKLDYLSAYYQVKDPLPWVKQLNIGDYSISMGQGLIAHSAFGVGKSSLSTNIKKGRGGIRSFNSVTENQALRGLATSLRVNQNIDALLFASYAARDANIIEEDGTGIRTFSSLPTSGLHRTAGEIADHDQTYEFTTGAQVQLRHKEVLKLGLNVIHHRFDKAFIPRIQPYQLFRWSGDNLTNMSADYQLTKGGWNVFGEIARSSTRGIAHMHGLIKTLDPRFDLAVIYRDYSAEYQSLYGNAFGENTTVNNEKGVYAGMEFRPSRRWSIRAFVDHWQNDWLRFRVDGPSTGQEYLLRVDYTEKRKRQYYLQYRYEVKDENSEADLLVDRPVARFIQRLRLHGSHSLARGIQLRSRIEVSLYQKESQTEKGIMIYQDIISRKINSPLSVSARLAYFNISDFDARIYAYENDLLFEYYIPSFSGEGLRYYAHARYQLSRSLMAEVRWEQTKFFGASAVRSNNDLIEGSTISRVKAQVRWSF